MIQPSVRPAIVTATGPGSPADWPSSSSRRARGRRRPSDAKVEYNRDIRPILAENCFACHGPDSAARKADLRLDQREAAVEAGAIVPGDPETSELIARILDGRPPEVMPPPKSHKTLTAAQKELLEALGRRGGRVPAALVVHRPDAARAAGGEGRGVGPQPDRPLRPREAGGEGPDARPRGRPPDARPPPQPRPDRPAADARRGRGVRRRHVAGRLREARRPPAGLARTGASTAAATGSTRPATPTPTASTSTTSARCGRTATGSSTPSTATMPFDQFTIEQLAGDLLPDRTLDQQIASGFNRCNITTNEGGAIAEEYLVLYTRDRTETTSQVWLGLTAGCAVCHDHKFDPLTPEGVLRAVGVLQQHDAGGDGRQHQGHAADRLRPRRRRTAPAGTPWPASWPTPGRRSRPASRSPGADFDKWLAGGDAPSPLGGADPDARACELRGRPGRREAPTPKARRRGGLAGDRSELADAGDFEKDQAFAFGAWVKLAASRA